MAGSMKYNFVAVDSSTAQLAAVVASMEENLGNMRLLRTELEAMTQGSMSDSANTRLVKFNTDMDNYEMSINRVRAAIDRAAGTGGDMSHVDVAQGNRFAGIG